VTELPWLEWYQTLAKPAWTPTPRTIVTVWQVLYPIIVLTFGFVFVQAGRRTIPWLVALPFLINLVANLAFSPILFSLRSLTVASVDVLVVWGTILWMMVAVWPYARWVALAQIPYFIWVSIASVLQLSLSWMNRG
jgi:benzodiazapine receptor